MNEPEHTGPRDATLFAVAMGTLCLFVLAAPRARAVVWCHDYVWYRVTGGDAYNTDVDSLRARLHEDGYKRFPFSNAAESPDRAMKVLKPGYVIIIGDDHSGVVNAGGKIDHFIQLQGEVGKRRLPADLPQGPISGNAGGLFLDDDLEQMLGRRFSTRVPTVEVWRPIPRGSEPRP